MKLVPTFDLSVGELLRGREGSNNSLVVSPFWQKSESLVANSGYIFGHDYMSFEALGKAVGRCRIF